MQAQAAAPKAFGAAAVFERRVWNNLFQSTLSKSYFSLRRLPNREWIRLCWSAAKQAAINKAVAARLRMNAKKWDPIRVHWCLFAVVFRRLGCGYAAL